MIEIISVQKKEIVQVLTLHSFLDDSDNDEKSKALSIENCEILMDITNFVGNAPENQMDIITPIIPVVPDYQTAPTSEGVHSTIINENILRIYIPKRKKDAAHTAGLALSSIQAIPFALNNQYTCICANANTINTKRYNQIIHLIPQPYNNITFLQRRH